VRWLALTLTTPARLVAGGLVSFAVLLGCAIGGGELLSLAERADGSTPVDGRITSWVVAHRTGALTTVARWCSELGSTTVLLPLVAIVAFGLLWRRQFVLAGLLLLAWGGSIGLYDVTKLVVARPRPPADIQLSTAAGSSFPSGHATQSLATYVALVVVTIAVLPKARAPASVLAVALAAGVGWSRVYLGMHWATDVAAGWLIAAAWITIVVWLAARARSIRRQAPGATAGGSSATARSS
jgi:membrane-associated phospholipid phosphatase